MVINDRTGKKFGRLTALKYFKKEGKRAMYWECLCECGNSTVVRGDYLHRKNISCGCLMKEPKGPNLGRLIHGDSHKRMWKLWKGIKRRCYNSEAKEYKNYGGRGIKMCEDWFNDFKAFEKWALLNNYDDHLTIDRINVNGNYEPLNCRWITITEQKRNTQKTLFVELNGELTSLRNAHLIMKPNISYQTAKTRYHNGERDLSKLFAERTTSS